MSATIVELADGSRVISDGKRYEAGDFVRIVDGDGNEVGYWHQDEWRDDPELVMGAIIRAMAGERV